MKKSLLAVSAALCLTLTACPGPEAQPLPSVSPDPSPSPTAVHTQTVPFTLPLDPQGTWNPYLGSRGGNMALAPLVYDSLYELDRAFVPKPLLAQGAGVSEDGLVWTVELRRGVTFSNGQGLDAQTVAEAVTAAKGDKSLYAARLRDVRKVAAGEEGQVVFTLASPNADFLALLDFPIALVAGEAVYGTGRYVLEGETLRARTDGWRGTVEGLETIPLAAMESADQLIAAFDAGELGLAAADPTGPDALGFSGSYQTWEYPTSTMLYLGFRCDGGLCRSGEFRRAVSQAADRSALVAQVLGGHASVAALPVSPTSPRYDPDLAKALSYDPEGAEEALDALGYQLGEDGLRYQGKRPLTLTLLVNSNNVFKAELAQALADGLERLGVTVEIQALPWAEYEKALKQGKLDLYLGECRMTGDMDPRPFLTAGSGVCYGGYRSEALSRALENARATGTWTEFYTLWGQDPPLAPLCFKTGTLLTQWGQARGLEPTQGNLFYQMEGWSVAP